MADLRDKIRAREGTPEAKSSGKAGGKAGGKAKASSRRGEAEVKNLDSSGPALDVNRKLLFAAAGVAALAGLVAVMFLSDKTAEIAGKGAKVSVWTVRETLPARHELTEDDLVAREIPKAFLNDGYMAEDTPAVGLITLSPIAKGEVLNGIRIGKASGLTGIAPKLRANQRGFVYVPNGLQEVPLVKPDDMVDLIAALPEPGTERIISTTVLQKVRVMSVGDRFTNEATDSAPMGNSAISLAVPAHKVALLTILQQAGNLHFSLRAPGDTSDSPVRISEAEIERLVMGHVPRPPRPQAAAPQPRVRQVVRTQFVERRAPAPRPAYVAPRQAAPPPQPAPRPRQIEIYTGSQKQN
jgi:Flp pilus assembly protein CpaB